MEVNEAQVFFFDFFCLCSTKDQIVMVNGVSMENVHSNFTIHTLKSCGKTANVVSTERTPTKTATLLPIRLIGCFSKSQIFSFLRQ